MIVSRFVKIDEGAGWLKWEHAGKGKKYDTEVIKNPNLREYRSIRREDGYVRGFCDPYNKDVWMWRGELWHKAVAEHLKIPCHAWKFIIFPKRIKIHPQTQDGGWELVGKAIVGIGKDKVVEKLRKYEPQAKIED